MSYWAFLPAPLTAKFGKFSLYEHRSMYSSIGLNEHAVECSEYKIEK